MSTNNVCDYDGCNRPPGLLPVVVQFIKDGSTVRFCGVPHAAAWLARTMSARTYVSSTEANRPVLEAAENLWRTIEGDNR